MGAAERAEGWYYRWIWRAWFGSVEDGLWKGDVVAGGRMGLGSVRGRGDLVRSAVEKEKEKLKQPARGESQGERLCPLLVLASWRLVQEGRFGEGEDGDGCGLDMESGSWRRVAD
ncbi:hypothetical protein H0E87_027499 [Populus deltoides]|uniref:Uncharacterized protein n=1 Tax=Populus deltoides TaxID=3696 RepID=A0A8T2WXG3_POPDE|nr:hypothetical protein H0E87_027499 [Populus deltoides]